jgi:flagellar biosynthetic protein FliQ
MNEGTVIHIASQAMVMAVKLGAPILLVSLGVGVFVSMIQTVTQIQDFTLTFVPKLIGIVVVFVIAGHWMLIQFSTYTTQLFNELPRLLLSG